MKIISKFLLVITFAISMQACGGGDKANDDNKNSGDTIVANDTTAQTPPEKNTQPETKPADSTAKSQKEEKPEGKTAEERNTDLEKRLVGTWGDRPNMSQFTFKADGTYEEITPVPVIKGTYKVIGDILSLEGIKTMDGEKDEKYSIKYKVQVTDKKEIKLTTPDNPEYPRTLRYGEKLD
jgi:hypothetical protein